MTVADPLLRRVERRALVIALVSASVAWAVSGMEMAAAVLGGAALIAVSYGAIRRGVTGLVSAAAARGEAGEPAPRTGVWTGVLTLAFRYALLAGIAYVMIARLRMPPIGLLIGASAITAAAALELTRGARRS
jgi:hypothetical protein